MTKHANKRKPNRAIKTAISNGRLDSALGVLSRQHTATDRSTLIEVDVAADGHCFYRAVALQFLIDKRDHLPTFHERFITLFGDKAAAHAEIKTIFDSLQFYDGSTHFMLRNSPTLHALTGFPLRQRLAKYMRDHNNELINFFTTPDELLSHLVLMATNNEKWAGELEFYAMARMLNVQIERYEGVSVYENLELMSDLSQSQNIADYYVRSISDRPDVYGEKSNTVLRIVHDAQEHEHYCMLIPAKSLLRTTATPRETYSERLIIALKKQHRLLSVAQFLQHHWLKMLVGALIGGTAATLIVFAGAFVLATAATLCIAAAVGLVAGVSLSGMICKLTDYLREKKQNMISSSEKYSHQNLQALEAGLLKPRSRNIDKPNVLTGNYRNRESSGTSSVSLTFSLRLFGKAARKKDRSGHVNLVHSASQSNSHQTGTRRQQ